jgi:hypothetical protein
MKQPNKKIYSSKSINTGSVILIFFLNCNMHAINELANMFFINKDVLVSNNTTK